jgi:hypothetical protein
MALEADSSYVLGYPRRRTGRVMVERHAKQ